MTPQEFLDEFGTLAESAEGVPKLRELILQLAARGRLVPQQLDDGTADESFDEIMEERQRLTKAKEIRKQKKLDPIDDDAMLHSLPESWRWTRLGDVIDYNGRDKVESREIGPDEWLLDLKDIEKHTSRLIERTPFKASPSKSTKTRFLAGDVLYGKLRPYLNKVIVADEDGYCTTEIVPLRIYTGLDPDYLKYILRRPDFLDHVNELTYGINLPRLGTDDARAVAIPLPPLAEQHRIVSKVDELMGLCDRLEAVQGERRGVRVRLNRSSLDRLTSVSGVGARQRGSELSAAWQRVCDHFEVLYDTPETLPDLRQTILQLAVQGKLVPQDPNDEPVSLLLDENDQERNRLLDNGTIRGKKTKDTDATKQSLNRVPDGWDRRPLSDLCRFIDYRGKTPTRTPSGVRLITAKNVRMGSVENDPVEFVTDEQYEQWMTRGFPETGDLLFVTEGHTMGFVGMLDLPFRFALAQRTINLHPFAAGVNEYLFYYLMSPQFQSDVVRNATGSAAKGIKAAKLKQILIGVPPLSEQKRIVSKVTHLLSQVTRLESTLTRRESTRTQLLTAAIHSLLESDA